MSKIKKGKVYRLNYLTYKYYLINNDMLGLINNPTDGETFDIIIEKSSDYMFILNTERKMSDYLTVYKSIVKYIENNNIKPYDYYNKYRYKFEVRNASYKSASFFYLDEKTHIRGVNKHGRLFSTYSYFNQIMDTTIDKNFKLLEEL